MPPLSHRSKNAATARQRGTVSRPGTGPVSLTAVVALLLTSACNYSFRAGSFPPPHIRTIAVELFENETGRFELTALLHEELLNNLPSALGIRAAGEDVADAVVRGSITRYDVAAPNYRAGAGGERAEVIQRQVNLAVSVQIIDLVENVVLWESNSVIGQGEFLEGALEDGGRDEAIELVVQAIVDGAQSNW
jgi:hypothetical protein